MLSGIWPRGSSNAPGNGNTGITSGRSPGPRYSALIGIGSPGGSQVQFFSLARIPVAKPVSNFTQYALRKQNGRQPLSSFDGGIVIGAPGLEELHQLLAPPLPVPFAVALDDLEQRLGCFGAFAGGVERGRQIESRLMIQRVCGDFLCQLDERAARFGLFG